MTAAASRRDAWSFGGFECPLLFPYCLTLSLSNILLLFRELQSASSCMHTTSFARPSLHHTCNCLLEMPYTIMYYSAISPWSRFPCSFIGASVSEPHINGYELCEWDRYIYMYIYIMVRQSLVTPRPTPIIPYICCSNSTTCKFTFRL